MVIGSKMNDGHHQPSLPSCHAQGFAPQAGAFLFPEFPMCNCKTEIEQKLTERHPVNYTLKGGVLEAVDGRVGEGVAA